MALIPKRTAANDAAYNKIVERFNYLVRFRPNASVNGRLLTTKLWISQEEWKVIKQYHLDHYPSRLDRYQFQPLYFDGIRVHTRPRLFPTNKETS